MKRPDGARRGIAGLEGHSLARHGVARSGMTGQSRHGKQQNKVMTEKIEQIAASMLIVDFSLYPRLKIDSMHSRQIAEAIEAKADIPPIIADRKSKRIIDGVHRRKGYVFLNGEDALCPVILRDYKSESDMFEEAMRLNSSHGNNIQCSDRLHCISIARNLGLPDLAIAESLNITVKRLASIIELKSIRVTGGASTLKAMDVKSIKIEGEGSRANFISSKPATQHFVDQKRDMTPAQAAVNSRLAGSDQCYMARQLIWLAQEGMIDTSDQDLLDLLHQLAGLIEKLPKTAKAAA